MFTYSEKLTKRMQKYLATKGCAVSERDAHDTLDELISFVTQFNQSGKLMSDLLPPPPVPSRRGGA